MFDLVLLGHEGVLSVKYFLLSFNVFRNPTILFASIHILLSLCNVKVLELVEAQINHAHTCFVLLVAFHVNVNKIFSARKWFAL